MIVSLSDLHRAICKAPRPTQAGQQQIIYFDGGRVTLVAIKYRRGYMWGLNL